MSKVLTKKDLLKKAGDLKTEAVEVPEWDGVVMVKEMTAAQRDEFDDWILKSGDNRASFRAKVVAMCAVDEEGKPLFSPLDIPDLSKTSSKALGRISKKIFEISGFSQESVAVIEKNSEPVQSEDSNLDSAKN